MKVLVLTLSFLLALTEAKSSMGASILDYDDGSRPGGILEGIVQSMIALFLLYLMVKNNKRALIWVVIYLSIIISLFAIGEKTVGSALLILTVPAWLVLSFIRDKIDVSKPKVESNKKRDVTKERSSVSRTKVSLHDSVSHQGESTKTENLTGNTQHKNQNATEPVTVDERKPISMDKKLYSGGMIYKISGIPHQFNGTDFEEIDTEKSVVINGKIFKWNGNNFVEE